MAETTTGRPVSVSGEPHRHPAYRRLARACIALVRWQRTEATASAAPASPPKPTPATEVGDD